MAPPPLAFERTLVITAGPDEILGAFFDPSALPVWWDTVRSVTTPRPLGVYAVEWRATPFRDDVLGTLGGVFYGTVMDYRPRQGFSIAGAYWLPPGGLAFGPMALEVGCATTGPATRLHVRQSGSYEGPRWERYYRLIAAGWETSLLALKQYLEHPRAADGGGRQPQPPEAGERRTGGEQPRAADGGGRRGTRAPGRRHARGAGPAGRPR